MATKRTPEECLEAVKKAAGDRLTDDQLDDIFTLLQNRAKRRQSRNPGMSQDQAYAEAAMELAQQAKLEALIEKRNRYFSVLRAQQREARLKNFDNPGDGIAALNVGKEGSIYGEGLSVDAVSKGVEAQLRGGLLDSLRKNNLLEVAKLKNPEFEDRVAIEMSILNGNKTATPTGDRNAVALAKVFSEAIEASRVMSNEAGAFIRKLEGYIVHQTHDIYRIRKTPKDQWIKDALELLDVEKMFDPLKAEYNMGDVTKFLEQVYNNLASGIHLGHGDSDWLGGFKGPSNLARRMSEERVLHFKSPEAWMAYNRKYGTGSLYETVNAHLGKASRNIALLRTWGPNPEAAFTSEVDRQVVKLRDQGKYMEAERLWRSAKNGYIRAGFEQVTGIANIPDNVHLAWWGAGIRLAATMSKLGTLVLSSIPDIHVRSLALRHNGIGFLQSYSNAIQAVTARFNGGEQRQVADLMNVGTEGMLGAIFERFSATDTVPRRMAKLQNIYFKLNLGQWWNDSMSRGVGLILARNLSNLIEAGAKFSDLDSRLQTTLKRYGIGEDEWEVLKFAPTSLADGKKFLTAQGIDQIRDSEIARLARSELQTIDERLAGRTQRRLKAIEREQEWVEERTRKLREEHDVARQLLTDRQSKRTEKVSKDIAELEEKIWQRQDKLSEIAEFYSITKRSARAVGRDEEKIRRAVKELENDIKATLKRVEMLTKKENNDFLVRFQDREAELLAFAQEIGSRIDARREEIAKDAELHPRRIQRAIDRARDDLRTKLNAYYQDQVREAMTVAGARERALTRQDIPPGTVWGEAIRFLMQFKQYPVTFMTRHLNRELNRGAQVDKAGLASLIVGTTALGYVSLTAAELARGRKPREPEDYKGWADLFAASMIKGGGFGIFTDFLFGEYNRYGGGFAETLAGPVLGSVGDILRVWSAAMRGEDASAQAIRVVASNLPGANIFYARMALDYLILYNLQEWANPGYLRRYERRVQREQGQTFLIPPSEVVPRGGGLPRINRMFGE